MPFLKQFRRIIQPVPLLVGLAVGTAIGWGLGSWTTCAPTPGCHLRLDAVDTLVGLIAGLGTFITLLIGLGTVRRDNRERVRATILDSNRSAVRIKPLGPHRNSKIQIEVTNQTVVDMTDLAFVLDRGERCEKILHAERQLHSGRTFGTSHPAGELGLVFTGDENSARELVNKQLKPRVSFLFSIEGEPFVRNGNDVHAVLGSGIMSKGS